METIMLAGQFRSLTAFCEFANELVGDELVGYEGYVVRRIVHFQVIPASRGCDAVLLLELEAEDVTTDVGEEVLEVLE